MVFRRASVMLALVASLTAMGQIKIPGVKIPGLDVDPFKKEPITTSLKDAKWEARDRDGFTPREPMRNLASLQRTPTGGFILQPGYYGASLQSY